jgi:hypothetical protein
MTLFPALLGLPGQKSTQTTWLVSDDGQWIKCANISSSIAMASCCDTAVFLLVVLPL